MTRAAREMGKRAGTEVVKQNKVSTRERTERFAGSCTGVRYPCIYHCKKCFFEFIYEK